MKVLGFTEEQLFDFASENTRRILPPVVKNMDQMIFEELGCPEDFELPEFPPEEQMWVLTNSHKMLGAASLIYEEQLHFLAQKLDSDLYILPSSLHEVILLSTKMTENPSELAEMVAEVNEEQVDLEDQLSNNVYHYDKAFRKTSLVTDTLKKKLN